MNTQRHQQCYSRANLHWMMNKRRRVYWKCSTKIKLSQQNAIMWASSRIILHIASESVPQRLSSKMITLCWIQSRQFIGNTIAPIVSPAAIQAIHGLLHYLGCRIYVMFIRDFTMIRFIKCSKNAWRRTFQYRHSKNYQSNRFGLLIGWRRKASLP